MYMVSIIIYKEKISSLIQLIQFLINSANRMAKSKNRKNIQPGDVFKALEKGEFEEFLPRLKEELNCTYVHETFT